jgi:hypothetical protein
VDHEPGAGNGAMGGAGAVGGVGGVGGVGTVGGCGPAERRLRHRFRLCWCRTSCRRLMRISRRNSRPISRACFRMTSTSIRMSRCVLEVASATGVRDCCVGFSAMSMLSRPGIDGILPAKNCPAQIRLTVSAVKAPNIISLSLRIVSPSFRIERSWLSSYNVGTDAKHIWLRKC